MSSNVRVKNLGMQLYLHLHGYPLIIYMKFTFTQYNIELSQFCINILPRSSISSLIWYDMQGTMLAFIDLGENTYAKPKIEIHEIYHLHRSKQPDWYAHYKHKVKG